MQLLKTIAASGVSFSESNVLSSETIIDSIFQSCLRRWLCMAASTNAQRKKSASRS